MYQLYFSVALVLIIFSLPIYIQYTQLKLEQCKDDDSNVWSIFFAAPDLRVMLTIIIFPIIGITSIYEVLKSVVISQSIRPSLLLSAVISICWLVMLYLGFVQYSS